MGKVRTSVLFIDQAVCSLMSNSMFTMGYLLSPWVLPVVSLILVTSYLVISCLVHHAQSVVLCVCASCDKELTYLAKKYPETDLEKLVADGTLEPVEHSEWANPIVAILKLDKQRVHICGDFKGP